jgi:hypothetical protein
VEFDRRARLALILAGLAAGVGLLLLGVRFTGHDRIAGHAFDIPSQHHRIVVEVLNGSGRSGLARLGARRLRRQGLDVVLFGNGEAVDSTRIVARRGQRAPALRVRQALGVGQVVEQRDTLRRVDVTVLLGADFRPAEDGRP